MNIIPGRISSGSRVSVKNFIDPRLLPYNAADIRPRLSIFGFLLIPLVGTMLGLLISAELLSFDHGSVQPVLMIQG